MKLPTPREWFEFYITFYYNYLLFSIFIDATFSHHLSHCSHDGIAYYVKTTLTFQETTGPSNKIVWSSNFAKFFAELHRQMFKYRTHIKKCELYNMK